MLYPKNKEKKLSDELFKNPTSEYRGTPFWAWNCELNKSELLWQIEQLKAMGFGGFHMHSRAGMATPYLSDEFADLIKACTDKAEREKMRSYLYDEDKWPSGYAGGLVTKNRKYSSRYLLFTTSPQEYCKDIAQAKENGECYLLAVFDVLLNSAGELESYKKIGESDAAVGTKWYAYTDTKKSSGWYNNQTYVDTLSKEAINKFIDITYNFYDKTVGDKFGNIIPSIFTDEPQYSKKSTLSFADDTSDITLPWTIEYDIQFLEKYGYSIIDKLPEIFWELPNGKISVARYNYHDFTTELFAKNFADNCGKWCREHNIALTGHMMAEDTLESQSIHVGEAMRSYRAFDIPGIDMLCNVCEYSTAKQAQSAVHQFGREGMTSELYGVTNWDFDFRGHKFQGDWQAALGVTIRVPHLSWVSMKGDAKRDYPASINYQSPWYKEYRYVEDHFARLNTALTRGKPVVKIGVVHPIETYWLHYGPKENTADIRKILDTQFKNTCSWLLSGLLDFDYICESLLPDLYNPSGKTLNVGEMEYSAIIISGSETLRSSTIKILTDYVNAGGKVIIAGDAPTMADAIPSDSLSELVSKATTIQLSKTSLLNALAEERIIDIRENDGSRTENMLYQLREDNDCKWLFAAHMAEEKESKNIPIAHKRKIIIKGEYTPVLYNTLNGEIEKVEFEIKNGSTIVYYDFYMQDSILLKLNELTDTEYKKKITEKSVIATEYILHKVEYTLSEPNVLLLDLAEYKTDNEKEFLPPENTRKIESLSKEKYSLSNNGAQPWVLENNTNEHSITLRYRFNSEIELTDALLATEDADICKIVFNNECVENIVEGYFTDKSIGTIKLPKIIIGENVLEITYPLGDRTNVEDCFILGHFNVLLEGVEKTLISPTSKIGFGDIVSQGLPFYGANITYKTEINVPEDCDVKIMVGSYIGAVMKASFDGEDLGVIAYAPYEVYIKDAKKGKHILTLTLFGNRHNSFGALHINNTKTTWFGPGAWDFKIDYRVYDGGIAYLNEDDTKYEYSLKPFGILASPKIKYLK